MYEKSKMSQYLDSYALKGLSVSSEINVRVNEYISYFFIARLVAASYNRSQSQKFHNRKNLHKGSSMVMVIKICYFSVI